MIEFQLLSYRCCCTWCWMNAMELHLGSVAQGCICVFVKCNNGNQPNTHICPNTFLLVCSGFDVSTFILDGFFFRFGIVVFFLLAVRLAYFDAQIVHEHEWSVCVYMVCIWRIGVQLTHCTTCHNSIFEYKPIRPLFVIVTCATFINKQPRLTNKKPSCETAWYSSAINGINN